MKKIITTAIGSLLFVSSMVQSDERYTHFPSLESPDTSVALCNLVKFNKKLKVIANKKDMTPEDMVKVHELTYTLENAVIRLQKDLETIAVDLEKVHKASERLDNKTIENSGAKYLEATELFLTQKSCESSK